MHRATQKHTRGLNHLASNACALSLSWQTVGTGIRNAALVAGRLVQLLETQLSSGQLPFPHNGEPRLRPGRQGEITRALLTCLAKSWTWN